MANTYSNSKNSDRSYTKRNNKNFNRNSNHKNSRNFSQNDGYQSKPRNNSSAPKEPAIRKFIIGTKDLDNKVAEFSYDRGLYLIIDITGEERSEVYKSRNMQEAYATWNIHIGRKKERPSRKRESSHENIEQKVERSVETSAPQRTEKTADKDFESGFSHQSRAKAPEPDGNRAVLERMKNPNRSGRFNRSASASASRDNAHFSEHPDAEKKRKYNPRTRRNNRPKGNLSGVQSDS